MGVKKDRKQTFSDSVLIFFNEYYITKKIIKTKLTKCFSTFKFIFNCEVSKDRVTEVVHQYNVKVRNCLLKFCFGLFQR